MTAIVGLGGPSTATQFAIDGPEGSVVAGDQLQRDMSRNLIIYGSLIFC